MSTLLTTADAPAAAPAVGNAPAPAASNAPAPAAPAAPAAPVAGAPAAGTPPAAPAAAPKPGDAPAAPAAAVADAPKPLALTLPENALLDADDLAAVAKFATDQKLSPEAAQALVARDNALMGEIVADMRAGIESQSKAWLAEFEADKDFGGAKAKESVTLATRALREHAGADLPALSKLLDETGLGNHPALLRMLARVGRKMAEDNPTAPTAGDGAPKAKTLGDSLYG